LLDLISSGWNGEALKKHNPKTKIIGIISQSHNHIPGGREEHEMWEVGLFDKNFYHDIISTNVDDAINGMLTLTRKCGILCGPTSGANYAATIKYLKEINDKHSPDKRKLKVAFIVCDRIELYLSYIEKYRPELFGGKQLSISNTDYAHAQVPTITPKVLSSNLDKGRVIIDTRTNDAYQLGHIKNAINLREDILQEIIQKPFLPNEEIVIYCRKGEVSRKFVSILRSQHYNAFSLQGGIQSWVNEGYELVESADYCDIPSLNL